jgi:hypothetical protein
MRARSGWGAARSPRGLENPAPTQKDAAAYRLPAPAYGTWCCTKPAAGCSPASSRQLAARVARVSTARVAGRGASHLGRAACAHTDLCDVYRREDIGGEERRGRVIEAQEHDAVGRGALSRRTLRSSRRSRGHDGRAEPCIWEDPRVILPGMARQHAHVGPERACTQCRPQVRRSLNGIIGTLHGIIGNITTLSVPLTALSVPLTALSVPLTALSVPLTALSVPSLQATPSAGATGKGSHCAHSRPRRGQRLARAGW